MTLTAFNERIELLEADEKARTVKQVLIRAGISLNNRNYPATVLQDAAALFSDKPTFADHGGIFSGQSILKATGWVRDVHYDEAHKGLVGTRYFASTEAANTIWNLVQDIMSGRAPADLFGASIVAAGNGDWDDEGIYQVSDIVEVLSIDDVAFPAAQQGQSSFVASDGNQLANMVMKHFEYEEWLQSRPDFVKRLRAEMKSVRQSEALKSLKEKNEELRQDITDLLRANEAAEERLELASRELAVSKSLEGVRLPAQWKDSLKVQMMEVSVENWADLIEVEEAKARGTRAYSHSGIGKVVRVQESLEVAAKTALGPMDNVEDYLRKRGK